MFTVIHIYSDDIDDVHRAYFSTKYKAEKYAIDNIQCHIKKFIDLTDPNDVAFVSKVNDFVSKLQWNEAIDCFNQEEYKFCGSGCHFFYIEEDKLDDHEIKDFSTSSVDSNTGAFPKSFFNSNDAEIPTAEEACNALVFKATTPGANCRKCNQHNKFVFADKPDGTYYCRGCKLMASVFGGNDE